MTNETVLMRIVFRPHSERNVDPNDNALAIYCTVGNVEEDIPHRPRGVSERLDIIPGLKADTPWGKHREQCHQSVTASPSIFSEAFILVREGKESRRRIREAIEIRERKPSITISSGWRLTGT